MKFFLIRPPVVQERVRKAGNTNISLVQLFGDVSRSESPTQSLMKTSEEMDKLLAEFTQATEDRKKTMDRVEAELLGLENREKGNLKKIEQLQNVPLPVAEHFAKLIFSGEKRSAKRDYVLFGAGVVVSTGIAIVLKLLGLG